MPSPSTSLRDRGLAPSAVEGFSMIEVIVVLGIIGIISSRGIIAEIDMYQRYNFRSDIDSITVFLEKARSQSINNIGGAAYGVKIDDAEKKLILFKGATFDTRDTSYDFEIAMNPASVYSGASEVGFAQLSGQVALCVTPCTINVTDGPRIISVTVNHEGGINY